MQRCRSTRLLAAFGATVAGVLFALSSASAHARLLPNAPDASGAEPAWGGTMIARIALPSVVEAKHSDVSLGEVASLASPSLSTLRKLMRLPLGRLPKSGESAHLNRAALASWIRARAGIDPRRIAWSGAEGVDITLSTRELGGEALASAAAASLRNWLATRSTRSSIELSRTPGNLIVPAGKVKLQVRPIPNAALLAKRMSVWVDVWVDDRFIRTVPVSFEVSAYERGYVADLGAASGSPLDQVAMQPREVDLTTVPSKTVLTDWKSASADHLRLRHAVAAGEIVTRDNVELRPAVSRGDWATLHATEGAVNLEGRVEVLEDGRTGQLVHVKLSNATAPMLARVVGEHMVEIKQ
ncbi:flagella basal body P-ring formation protein FlgA [Ralstonia sp. 1138]|uniref:flagella basal body P-ring formation protein FlgA n=1 Tax=Ralstonia sp. 1138 TaxID=3156423 RepID=UPI003391D6F8